MPGAEERGGAADGQGAEAFEEFFDRLMPRALLVGRRILGSRADAEDAAVEAMARAYVAWGRIGAAAHRDAWVLRVTANVAYDQVRRRKRELGPLQPAAEREPAAEVELRLTLLPLLRRLSRRQREVVTLSYLAGLTHEEIAAALGCSVGSVKVHARRGMDKLRADLGVVPQRIEEA
ncbi:MAG TPA: sigma-70 family RNA polymerase sigma factor [Acidimicrobiales bacterium]|nr:sigma-70 family RNA polymerase sigma factor [Acidimicrobiales bacterium]